MRTVKITVKDGEKETAILLDTIEPVSKITATMAESLRGIGFVSGSVFEKPKKPVTTIGRLVEVRTSEMIEDGERNRKISATLSRIHPSKRKVKNSDGKCFDSIADAARFVKGFSGNIVKCLHGQIKTAYGYKWEYII